MGIPKNLSTPHQILIVKPKVCLQLLAAGFDLSLAVVLYYRALPFNVRLLAFTRLVIDLSSIVIASNLD